MHNANARGRGKSAYRVRVAMAYGVSTQFIPTATRSTNTLTQHRDGGGGDNNGARTSTFFFSPAVYVRAYYAFVSARMCVRRCRRRRRRGWVGVCDCICVRVCVPDNSRTERDTMGV